nr:8694_t:CDS:2 [Entrophospora candida]
MLKEFKQRLFLPHYVANLLFILPYLIIRYILPYDYLDISIELPEKRIYMIFTFLISLKYKTTGSLEEFLSITFIYGKLFNLIMFSLYGKFYLSILYIISWFVLYVVLPQPSYQGSSKIIEITEEDLNKIQFNKKIKKFDNKDDAEDDGKDEKGKKKSDLDDEEEDEDQDGKQEASQSSKLRKKKNKIEEEEGENEEYWIIFCYVSWSNVCRNFEPVVAETSLKNINFAKIDLEKYPSVADEYNISLSPSNFDIPTLLLLKNGDLISRLPQDPDTIINQNDQMKQVKSPLIKNIKVTWDRLGWGRDMLILNPANLTTCEGTTTSLAM